MTRQAVLSAEGVTKRFGSHTAVDDVTLSVSPGRVVGLVGANGAGKTTLIRIVLGLLVPDAGSVSLPGGASTDPNKNGVSYVPQGSGLWPDLTVAEHLDLIAGAHGLARAAVELADGADDRRVAEMPIGLRRRAAFLVATAHQPAALVLDEPTSGVDPLARRRLWESLRKATEHGAGALVTTHHLAEAEHCDEVVLLVGGRVAAAGSPEALVRGRTVVEVDADDWQQAWTVLDGGGFGVLPAGRTLRVSGAAGQQVQRRLARAGVLAQVRTVPATLEELFVDTAGAA